MRGGLTRKFAVVAVAALSLLLLFAGGVLSSHNNASAADAETSKLIGDFNQYRAQHGIGALSTGGNSDAQSIASQVAADCSYGPILQSRHSRTWGTYGYPNADQVWDAYKNDSQVTGWIGDPYYGSTGVGRVASTNCSFGPIWIIVLDKGASGTISPTLTPTPTPSKTPTPTPSKTPTPTPGGTVAPTPTATPAPTATPVPTSPGTPTDTPLTTPTATAHGSETPTATPVPTSTPASYLPGDANCDQRVDDEDGIAMLMWISHIQVYLPCMHLDGVDCTGSIDIFDVLAVISYLGQIPYTLPDGCPPIGAPVTPTPTAPPSQTSAPSETPTPTPTSVPTETPTPAPTAAPGGVNACELALVAYQMSEGGLNGETHCTPDAGTSYDCVFGSQSAACVSSTSDVPSYTCWFTTGFADCVPDSGQPEYQCFLNQPGAVGCSPTHIGYAGYDCDVAGGTVDCASDTAGVPSFACTRQESGDFSCVALS